MSKVARGGHRKGILATHTCCAGGTWYVDLAEEEMRNTLGKGGTELLGNEKSQRGTGHERDRVLLFLSFLVFHSQN